MNLKKGIITLVMAVVMILGTTSVTFACTGVYVGSDLSANGSTFVGRSEDIDDLYCKIFGVKPAEDLPEGNIYRDAYGFSMPYSGHKYQYTYIKDTPQYEETLTDNSGNYIGEAYAEAGQNEKGVAVTATVSTSNSPQAKEADPLVDTGICEISMTSILLGSSSTAREAVNLLASIIDQYGAGECNSLMISDPNETWYFEIVSGHQYAAVKMPSNKMSIQPNLMLLGVIDVNDTENVVTSPNLVSLASDNGFLVTDENGKINVTMTYAPEKPSIKNYQRYWQGLFYINSAAAENLDIENINNRVNPVPMFVEPAKKLTTFEILRLLGYRGEETKYDANTTNSYAIGNTNQTECHFFEIRKGYPTKLATLQWEALADAEFSIYQPYYTALITDVHAAYNEPSKDFVKGSINWNFAQINYLCSQNRSAYGKYIKQYFEQYQKSIISQQEAVDQAMLKLYAKDPQLAAQKATESGKALAQQILDMSTSVLEELEAYIQKGDFSKSFVPSAMTKNIMPIYNISVDEDNSASSTTVDAGKKIQLLTQEKLTFAKGSSNALQMRFNPPLENLVNVYVDGKILTEGKDYTKKSGSTIITLSNELLASLTPGNHTLTAEFKSGGGFEGGKIDASFTVEAQKAGVKPVSTGDNLNLSTPLAILLISLILIFALALAHKKSSNR